MSKSDDLMILQKCYDMIEWSYPALKHYPKSERYAIVSDTKSCMHELLGLIIRANKRYYKKTTLQDIDIELEKLRHFIRLANGLGFLPFKKYENWSRKLTELGKMLGGWFKSMEK